MEMKEFQPQKIKKQKIKQKLTKTPTKSNKDINNGQIPPKVRAKTVTEAHLGAQKAYGHHWGSGECSSFWGPGAP